MPKGIKLFIGQETRKTCKGCEKTETLICSKMYKNQGGFHGRWQSQDGSFWENNWCRKCYQIDWNKKYSTPRSRSKDANTKKGYECELYTKTMLEKMGWKVSQAVCFGPDLVCRRGNKKLIVEVKSVAKKVRKNGKVKYYSSTVKESELKRADVIAFVFDENHIYLAQTAKVNGRDVTSLALELGLPARI